MHSWAWRKAAVASTVTPQVHTITASTAQHHVHARAIADLARAHADDIDKARALTPDLIACIRHHAFFHLLVPQVYGGAELALPDYVPLVETIAAGDASTAWCVNQAAVYASMACRAEPETASEIWGDPATSVANGPPAPARVVAVAGGFRITGRWDFSSGCRHANWLAAATPIDGVLSVCMLPAADVTLIDNWDVPGLRGTGSFSFSVDDVFVRARRTFRFNTGSLVQGPLYRLPINLMFASGFAAVALGNARSALDATLALLSDKRPVFESAQVRDRSSVQLDIARAEAAWGAARAYLQQQLYVLWSSALNDVAPDLNARIGVRLAATHAIHCAAEAVQLAYRLSGSTAIFQNQPMQRRFQDAHVITQQVQGRLAHYETVGQHLLGMNPKPHFF